jgi:hypothetical protein
MAWQKPPVSFTFSYRYHGLTAQGLRSSPSGEFGRQPLCTDRLLGEVARRITADISANGAADNPPAGQPLASWPAGRVHPLGATRSPEPEQSGERAAKVERSLTTVCPCRCDDSTFCAKHQPLSSRCRSDSTFPWRATGPQSLRQAQGRRQKREGKAVSAEPDRTTPPSRWLW